MTEYPPLSATFIGSAGSLSQCPVDDVPEIAFVGRSNAGKSSTLNRIYGSKRLARVSKTPGRTRLINLFITSWGFRVADLPGYGFARASKKEIQRWNESTNTYLERRDNLVGLVQVIDVRHPLKAYDLDMFAWAQARDIAVLFLLNKSDKLSKNERVQALARAKKQIELEESESMVLFSATTSLGLDAATTWFQQFSSYQTFSEPAS